MTEKKPKILVFDLDYTLWPFWVDTHVTPPFRKSQTNDITDRSGYKICPYPHSTEILKKMSEEGYEIGIASRTSAIEEANQLLKLLEWDKYIKYKQIYPGNKTSHFERIKQSSGVEFDQMIFFDDETRNINDVKKLGVLALLVENGITHDIVQNALTKFGTKK